MSGRQSVTEFRRAARLVWLAALWLPLATGCAWVHSLAGSRSGECRQLTERARQARDSGDFAEAERLLTEAASNNPQDVECRWELCELHLEVGRADAASEELQQLIQHAPDDPRGYLELARLRLERGEIDESARLLETALDLAPERVDALLLMGQIEEQREQLQEALDLYHRVLQIESENATAMLRLGIIQLELGKPDRAAPVLRLVSQSAGASPEQQAEALWHLGLAYGAADRWRDSAAALAAALPRRTAAADDWYRLAYARSRAGDTEGAARDLEEALRLEPAHARSAELSAELRRVPAQEAQKGVLPVGHREWAARADAGSRAN